MAKRKITLEIEFERTDDTSKRLPTRAEMTQWVLAALSVPAQFCVRFVEQEEGQELNKTYRGKDYATNVLTFDYQHEPTAEADIVICTPVKQRNRTKHSVLTLLISWCIQRCTLKDGIMTRTKKLRLWKVRSAKY